MENREESRLTSAELANLWRLYITENLMYQFKTPLIDNCQDPDIRSAIEFSRAISEHYIVSIENIFRNENYPVPTAYSENDIHPQAPALFTDVFCLHFIHQGAQLGMSKIHEMMAVAVRQDVWEVLNQGANDFKDLYQQSLQLLLTKGLYSRPAFLPPEKESRFAENKHYVSGWLGNQRPLNALEIMSIHNTIIQNGISKAILRAFAQVINDKKLRDYLEKGAETASDIMRELEDWLIMENTNVTATLDSEILPTETPPYSDKLMMMLIANVGVGSLGVYGNALSTVFRRDLGLKFMHLMKDAVQYAQEGLHLVIDKGWMEVPPQFPDINTR
ncbi:DUF3231 family protein [Salicibibacter kimchii]|uniref:DUF3231 family protein n=1 Tax=Salicibibacter kimchii TaxID=2099786 RepID=A0A345BZG8_9BACI|nr:DUF3231 family protein [Salicibibacter kimchii]AXF56349.1 DUF3231 family protein [Salicibibacter kimchii]